MFNFAKINKSSQIFPRVFYNFFSENQEGDSHLKTISVWNGLITF